MSKKNPINIHINEKGWKRSVVDLNERSFNVVAAVMKKVKGAKKGEIALVFTNDAEIREINHQFRSKNKATNVLSFPSDEVGEVGDVILALETIKREAKEQGKAIAAHTTHMLVHGVLHLLGHDHVQERDAQNMEALEISILKSLGIANPYEKG